MRFSRKNILFFSFEAREHLGILFFPVSQAATGKSWYCMSFGDCARPGPKSTSIFHPHVTIDLRYVALRKSDKYISTEKTTDDLSVRIPAIARTHFNNWNFDMAKLLWSKSRAMPNTPYLGEGFHSRGVGLQITGSISGQTKLHVKTWASQSNYLLGPPLRWYRCRHLELNSPITSLLHVWPKCIQFSKSRVDFPRLWEKSSSWCRRIVCSWCKFRFGASWNWVQSSNQRLLLPKTNMRVFSRWTVIYCGWGATIGGKWQ